MQIGGFGGHGTSDHHVTNCLHDHHGAQKISGGASMKASAATEISAVKGELQQEGQLSLSAWLKNMLGNGRGHLLGFWEGGQISAGGIEGNQTAINSAEGSHAAASQAVMQTGAPDTTAAAVQPGNINNSSYPMDPGRSRSQKRSFWRRAREHFRNMSEWSDGKRPQSFSGVRTKKSFFQAKRENPEDLRRHNRCRRDTVEINCAPTEESYLMDSYDRKGEYSRLTTKK